MVDEFPQFPVMQCSVCEECFEVPRKRVTLRGLGLQLIMDWEAAKDLMQFHHSTHKEDLIQGIEEYLAKNA